MSSTPVDHTSRRSAEAVYRDAFERLKCGMPKRLPKGSSVSQNNVAKEAGSDPSALKKARFPTLIAEIQRYVAEHRTDRQPSPRQSMLAQRGRNRNLRERIGEISMQRDQMACMLNEANAKILELMERVAELEAKLPILNVVPIFTSNPGNQDGG